MHASVQEEHLLSSTNSILEMKYLKISVLYNHLLLDWHITVYL